MVSRSLQRARRQVRWFIIIWTAITLFMGLVTFLAIYFTYRPANAESGRIAIGLPERDTSDVQTLAPTPEPPVAAGATGQDNAQPAAPSTTPIPPSPTPLPTTVPTQVAALRPDATTGPLPTATIPPLQDDRFALGIQVQHSLDFNQENQNGFFETVRNNLGVEWVKMQVSWRDVEPTLGQRDFAKLDLAMNAQAIYGNRIMLSIVDAPQWAREPGVDLSRHGPPANNSTYVDFVRAIIQRYPGQVHAIEVWNEQNLDREWTSVNGLSATNYVALLRDTYTAIKAIDPNIIVISGALAPTGFDDETAINDFRYMQQMIDANMLNYADCIGAHHNGYNISPLVAWDAVPDDPSAVFRGPFNNPHHSWSFRSTLEGYATRIRAAGSDKRLCVTEFGWAVAEDIGGHPPDFGYAADNTLEEQAQFFTEALGFMQQSGIVWLAFIWNFNYGPQAGYNPQNDNVLYSLIGPGYTFRPAFDAIREWVQCCQQQAGGA